MPEIVSSESIKRIITFISVGLLRQLEPDETQPLQPVTMLKDMLRRGWEQYSYLCYSYGILPPSTLPEFVDLLHTPLNRWPAIPSGMLDDNGPLLQYGLPSPTCEHYGLDLLDIHVLDLELEDQYFRALFDICKQIGDPKIYSAVREFLVRNPLLSDPIEMILADPRWHDLVREPLKNCYEKLPRSCLYNGQVVLCPHCGWAMMWQHGEAHCYPEGACTFVQGDLSQSELVASYSPLLMRTRAGIQRYVVGVELDLINLYDNLSTLWGVTCELYPRFDAFDLYVKFPNGQCWAIDFKDYHRPRKLALALNQLVFTFRPEWDRAFYIFADYRSHPSYLNEFETFWMGQKGVSFMSASKILMLAKEEAVR
jgi:hypothetical protein